MVDKVVVVVVMKSKGGENHSFVFCVGMGRRNRSRRDLYNGCVEDINLSLYIRSEQLTSSHLTPPSVGFGFNLSLSLPLSPSSTAQLSSRLPRHARSLSLSAEWFAVSGRCCSPPDLTRHGPIVQTHDSDPKR